MEYAKEAQILFLPKVVVIRQGWAELAVIDLATTLRRDLVVLLFIELLWLVVPVV